MSLDALSPLDGRYAKDTQALAACFSERALIEARVQVEWAYLAAFLERDLGPLPPLKAEDVKAIEATTRHDMKAVEYWVKDQVPAEDREWVHFGLTSDDVNNLAWGLMHERALATVILPALAEVLEALAARATASRALPMLARTHGQPATPTTYGKEIGVFAARLARAADDLAALKPPGKLSGATGTFAALHLAYPDRDWLAFSHRFVAGLGLDPVEATTQVEPKDGLAAIYDACRRVGHVLADLVVDMWRYISDGWLVQAARPGEIGSSAMPHKVNPIDFENAEGNLGLADALFVHLGGKLTRSRLQRDLSDSTVMRNAGVAFGHLLLALRSVLRGLERCAPDEAAFAAALDAHPEVLAEAVQTLGRARGVDQPYEKLKALTRGRAVDLAALRAAGEQLAPGAVDWAGYGPAAYIGLAPALADRAAAAALATAARLRRAE